MNGAPVGNLNSSDVDGVGELGERDVDDAAGLPGGSSTGSRRTADEDFAGAGQGFDVAGVGLTLELVEPAERGGFEAWLGRVGVGKDGFDLDAHDAQPAVNPLGDADTLAGN